MIELTTQGATEGLDPCGIPAGDIGEGAGFDLSMVAERLAEEDGGRRSAIGDGGDVHAYIISLLIILVKHNNYNYMPT